MEETPASADKLTNAVSGQAPQEESSSISDADGAMDQPPPSLNVGILALEVYVPALVVEQSDLEEYDDVQGKYTTGLGQVRLGMCGDQEDVVSMALTAASNLLRRYSVAEHEIGRIDVGTESDIDSSKPIKSWLMDLIGSGDVEGGDHRSACYASTAALLAAVDWVTGAAWDGRYALVVASDVSVYADPGARATGGAGAVAMLIGPDAPLSVCRRSVSSHSCHSYDFYKPAGPIPQVNGKLSVSTYLSCLAKCFERLKLKHRFDSEALDAFEHVILHHPYNKLVQKGAAKLEALIREDCSSDSNGAEPEQTPKSVQSHSFYDSKVSESTLLGRHCGNMYTASLYACLASLVAAKGEELQGSQILMYAFGSGAMSSLFILKGRNPHDRRWHLGGLVKKLDLQHQLDARVRISPKQLDDHISQQIQRHGARDWQPSQSPLLNTQLRPGTFFLSSVDSQYRRYYGCRTGTGL